MEIQKENEVKPEVQPIEEKKEIIEEAPIKKKRVLSEKALENLKKGRDKLKEKNDEKKKTKEELNNKYLEKKMQLIQKQKQDIKKQYGVDDETDEEDDEEQVKYNVPVPKVLKQK